MTSTITAKGRTVVPKKLRERFDLRIGMTLDWQEDGDSIRVVMATEPKRIASGLAWFQRLGRVPSAPRDRRPVEHK